MKTIIFVLCSIVSLSFLEMANACSIQVNQLYEKNLLVGYAASEMGVDLSQATSISIASYSQSTSGGATASSCPQFLNTQARITVAYSRNLFTHCSFSVTVSKSEQIGEVLVAAPIIAISTTLPTSSCSRVIPRRPSFP